MRPGPVRPRALRPGSTIGIVAPASTVEDRAALDRGIAGLEGLGYRVVFDERIFDSERYLAGDDHARAEELMRAFEDPRLDGIISLRGGYGCARLIPWLDLDRLRPNCKFFMGFSDLTTLHLHFRRHLGWITIHGPMMTSGILSAGEADFLGHFQSLASDPGYLPEFSFTEMEGWRAGESEGEIVGGCLSLITASLGTPYEIDTEGRVLFLEEIGEEPYRLDRMITQLKLAGKLRSVAGIVLGSFVNCESEGKGYSSTEVLRDLLGDCGVPIVAGFRAGHEKANWPFAHGARVRLDAGIPSIRFLEPAVSR